MAENRKKYKKRGRQGKGKGKGKGQKNCPKMGRFFGPNVPIVSLRDVLGRIPGRRGKIPGRTPH